MRGATLAGALGALVVATYCASGSAQALGVVPRQRAGEETVPPVPHSGVEPYWYGWQGLGLDAAAISVMATAHETTQLIAGLSAYSLGAPITQLAHHNGIQALGSLGLRAVGVVGGAFVAIQVGCHDEDQERRVDCSDAFAAGYSVLAMAAIADAASFAYATDRPASRQQPDSSPSREPRESPRRSRELRLELAPSVAVTSEGFFVGAAGSF
ncbi:MAG: hypothetical protein U0263_40805 [Polyangiaceae bacterium]